MFTMRVHPARDLALALLLATLGALASGCAATAVKPWDRDLLAQKKMQFAPSTLQYSIDQHTYFSREGSTGGLNVGGGGCGCN
jgi:hypothetical protein